MERITVDIKGYWARLIRSPLYWVVAALTGVSITFCPLFLYQFGRAGADFTDWRVLGCFAIGYFVPMVHFGLASPVMKQLRQPLQPGSLSRQIT